MPVHCSLPSLERSDSFSKSVDSNANPFTIFDPNTTGLHWQQLLQRRLALPRRRNPAEPSERSWTRRPESAADSTYIFGPTLTTEFNIGAFDGRTTKPINPDYLLRVRCVPDFEAILPIPRWNDL